MKKTFTYKEILETVCVSMNTKLEYCSFMKNKKSVGLKRILNSEISLSDKTSLIFELCKILYFDGYKISLALAKVVLPIYKEQYPKEKVVSRCIAAIEKYLDGQMPGTQLILYRGDAFKAGELADRDANYKAAHVCNAIALIPRYASQAAIKAASGNILYEEQILTVLKSL